MRLLLAILLSLFGVIVLAQNSIKPFSCIYIEQIPEYPGGNAAMMQFIKSHIVYPDYALEHKIEGRVVIGFIVEEDGNLSNFEVKKGASKELDAEALRVTKLLPKFILGKNRGKKVKVPFVLPVIFKLPT